MQDEGDWSRRSLPLVPQVLLANKYKALGKESEQSMDNISKPERDNQVRMLQVRIRVIELQNNRIISVRWDA